MALSFEQACGALSLTTIGSVLIWLESKNNGILLLPVALLIIFVISSQDDEDS